MSPFCVTAETKKLVVDNISCLLNNFLKCTEFENIIFCWVMHKQEIMDEILSRIDISDCEVKLISLVCNEQSLRRRLQNDIDNGIRTPDIIDRSISYLSMYDRLKTIKIDVSDITAEETADIILKYN